MLIPLVQLHFYCEFLGFLSDAVQVSFLLVSCAAISARRFGTTQRRHLRVSKQYLYITLLSLHRPSEVTILILPIQLNSWINNTNLYNRLTFNCSSWNSSDWSCYIGWPSSQSAGSFLRPSHFYTR